MLSERVETHLQRVVLVDGVNRSHFWLEDPEESLDKGRLSGTSPADHSYFFSWSYCDREVLEGQ